MDTRLVVVMQEEATVIFNFELKAHIKERTNNGS